MDRSQFALAAVDGVATLGLWIEVRMPIANTPPPSRKLPDDLVQALNGLYHRYRFAARRLAHRLGKSGVVVEHDFTAFIGAIDGSGEPIDLNLIWTTWDAQAELEAHAQTILRRGQLTPAEVVRFLQLMQHCNLSWGDRGTAIFATSFWPALCVVSTATPITLLDWALVLEQLGVPRADIFDAARHIYGHSLVQWPAELLAPYLLAERGRVEALLSASHTPDELKRFLELVRAAALAPTWLTEKVLDLALTGPRDQRAIAQAFLRAVPEIAGPLVVALGDSDAGKRTIAATWAASQLGVTVIEPLRHQLGKEKQALARSAQIEALVSLGVSVATLFDRKGLLAAAAKSAKKGWPSDLDWLALNAMPPLFWADGGAVALDLVSHLVLTAHKLKSPSPDAEARHIAALFTPDSRRALGEALLVAWLANDTRLPNAAEQATIAGEMRAAFPLMEADYLAEQIVAKVALPIKSSMKAKGVLGLVGALGSDVGVTRTRNFLRRWYGNRAPQCTTLLEMVASFDTPEAWELVIGTARHFRTKSIMERASELVAEAAARRAWTKQRLEDELLSRAGLDDEGYAELDAVGGGAVRVLLHLNIEIVPSSDGVVASQAQIAQLGQNVHRTWRHLGERFDEAMCCAYRWPLDVWRSAFATHPIARLGCRQVLWVVESGDTVTAAQWRDPEFVAIDGRALSLDADVALRVAHPSDLDPAELATWRSRRPFAPEVALLLFDQLAADVAAPAELIPDPENHLIGMRGQLVGARELVAGARARGYRPADQAGDGRYCTLFRKAFALSDLEVLVEHSGFVLNDGKPPKQEVALLSVAFISLAEGFQPDYLIPTALEPVKVPTALVHEVLADVRAFAAAGRGFDPAWEDLIDSL